MHKKILIIENDPLNVSLFKEGLGHAWELLFVSTFDDAFKILNMDPVQLIILNVNIEGKTAFDFMLRLSESKENRDTSTVFVTEMKDRHVMHTAMKIGGTGYIFKPLDIQEIQLTVRNQMKLMGV